MEQAPQRRKEDKFPGRVWTFFVRFFIVAGVAGTISFILIAVTLSRVVHYTPPPLPDKILLAYDFKGAIVETIGKPSLSQPLLRPGTTLRDVTEALANAAKDDRVKGFVAKLEDPKLSVAQIQELRDAVHAFRKTGKFAWIYTDSFTPGMAAYYLATSFDKIWLQPVGAVAITGIGAEVPFAKDLLDKIGVTAEFSHKGIYKSMPESLTRTNMSDPNREMTTALVGDLSQQIVAGIAADRKLTVEDVRAKIDRAPFDDKDALAAGLIDHIGYYDEMMDEAKKRAGAGDDNVVNLTGYAFLSDSAMKNGMVGFTTKLMRSTSPPGTYKDKNKIALIYGVGDIVPYTSQTHGSLIDGEGGMAAEKVVEAFHAAMKDPDVVAVVFRIDSPGGSPEAAESIRRAMVEMQKKGRPVIVSMSSYAASGGYWIAASANKIVAEPATVNGSIGVFGGKIEASKLWGKIGLNWEGVSGAKNALMWSSNRPFTEEQSARFESMLGNIYDGFIARVAEGRHMSKEKVEAIAEGRVWTGTQAKDRGLVDELGGLDHAIVLAKKAANLSPTEDIPVLQYPPQKSAFEMFISMAINGPDASVWPAVSARDVLESVVPQDDARSNVLKTPEIRFY